MLGTPPAFILSQDQTLQLFQNNSLGPTHYSLFSFQRTDSTRSGDSYSITPPPAPSSSLFENSRRDRAYTAFFFLGQELLCFPFSTATVSLSSRSEGAFLHTLLPTVKHLFYFFSPLPFPTPCHAETLSRSRTTSSTGFTPPCQHSFSIMALVQNFRPFRPNP